MNGDLGMRHAIDHWANTRAGLPRISQMQLGHRPCEDGRKGVGNIVLKVEHPGGRAPLPCGLEG